MKKEVPSKERVYQQLQATQMSEDAQSIVLCMVNSAWFDYCIIVKQLTMSLEMSKQAVERSLSELINIGLVKQQALFGSERTYILNKGFFTKERPPRRSREELKNLLKVHSN